MAMAATPCNSPLLSLFFSSFIFFLHFANSTHFNISKFERDDPNILYLGDATRDEDGKIKFFHPNSVGWVTYAKEVLIWDSNTQKLTDFTTHYSFIVDTHGRSDGGGALAFFLVPLEFQMPANSPGPHLGLYNITDSHSYYHPIVYVLFDSLSNTHLGDPQAKHVGINIGWITSSVSTKWNVDQHSGDITNVWITYNSTTKNLSVSWKYQGSFDPEENASLSYQVDFRKALPNWVKIGFSSAMELVGVEHTIFSWEFNSTLEIADTGPKSGEKTTKPRLGVILGCAILIVGAIIGFAILLWKYKTTKSRETETSTLASINDYLIRSAGPRRFSYKQLVLATAGFSSERKLGQGGFGAVYRGYLAYLEMHVAVKKISRGSRQGRREYETEVKVISRLKHRNLVQLIGCCHEKGELLLVYEFMANGSLDCHLFGKKPPLAWSVRRKIAQGLASALLYLHEEWEQCVLHRDIKSSNIMLDSNFNVKLGDFGLAKLMDHELGSKTTRLAGTPGYLAPEYISTGRASKESDIYSFGVVALEIATGRKATDLVEEKDGEKGLIEWVRDHYDRDELFMAIDEKLEMDYDKKEIECLVIVGLWCSHPKRNMRPSIRQALQVLNFETTLPSLPPEMPVPTYIKFPHKQ